MLVVLMTMAPVLSLRRQARLAVDHKAARKNKKPYYNSHKRKSIKVLIQLTRVWWQKWDTELQRWITDCW